MIAEAQFFFRPSKRVQDSLEYWIPRGGLWIPGTGFRILSQWNLHFRFQSLVGLGFFDPYYGFQSPGFRICTDNSMICSGIWHKYHE